MPRKKTNQSPTTTDVEPTVQDVAEVLSKMLGSVEMVLSRQLNELRSGFVDLSYRLESLERMSRDCEIRLKGANERLGRLEDWKRSERKQS